MSKYMLKNHGTALMETKPIQVYKNENHLKCNLFPNFDFIIELIWKSEHPTLLVQISIIFFFCFFF